ncbi:hypothetical protein FCULG_00007125 [Fusarium culmorum]|uniref:Uncharacterized protein n=1 Tax=Fusarium culmorum TaxID=5516 RepID=A0A2T4GXT3_FUSCU|nr:hypothetical protein FCULG_00007125 [Fusarium culmorum]
MVKIIRAVIKEVKKETKSEGGLILRANVKARKEKSIGIKLEDKDSDFGLSDTDDGESSESDNKSTADAADEDDGDSSGNDSSGSSVNKA